MRSTLPALAREIRAGERTLRRAASRGMVRCRRSGPRSLEIDPEEREYLHTHWELLSTLARALRTEPNVSLAVLYGSTARGDERSDSDVDLLVALREDGPDAVSALARRLEHAIGRRVDLARLERVRVDAPVLAFLALDEGRVLVDRDGRWRELSVRRGPLRRAAERAQAAARREAADSLRMLIEDAGR